MLKKIILFLIASSPLFTAAQGSWTVYDASNSGLPASAVYSVAAAPNGDIWAVTDSGVVHFDGATFTTYDTVISPSPHLIIYNVVVSSANIVYISSGAGLTVYDGVSWTTYTSATGLPVFSGIPTRIRLDHNNHLWGLDFYGFGLFRFDGTTWDHFRADSLQLPPFFTFDIDIDNNVWIAPQYGGEVIKYNGSHWTRHTLACQCPEVRTVGTDALGHVWTCAESCGFIDCQFPVSEYNGAAWTHYNQLTASFSPSSDYTRIIIADSDNVKWFGSTYLGLAKLDGAAWTFYNRANSGLPDDNVLSIAIDALGNKWVGTLSGLAKFSDGGAGPISTALNISGTITSETGLPVPGTIVRLSGDKTDSLTTTADGQYTFSVEPGGSYTITASKSNDMVPNNGISSLDILLMRRHVLGMGNLASPFKIIAGAECNAPGDTQVSTLDILFSRALILGNATGYPTGRLWQFIPASYIFPDNNHPFPFPTALTYTHITTHQTNQDFIGIKLGDVNDSWDPGVH